MSKVPYVIIASVEHVDSGETFPVQLGVKCHPSELTWQYVSELILNEAMRDTTIIVDGEEEEAFEEFEEPYSVQWVRAFVYASPAVAFDITPTYTQSGLVTTVR